MSTPPRTPTPLSFNHALTKIRTHPPLPSHLHEDSEVRSDVPKDWFTRHRISSRTVQNTSEVNTSVQDLIPPPVRMSASVLYPDTWGMLVSGNGVKAEKGSMNEAGTGEGEEVAGSEKKENGKKVDGSNLVSLLEGEETSDEEQADNGKKEKAKL